MKKQFSFLLVLALLLSCLCAVPVAAENGTVTMKASEETVTVGGSVTVTVNYSASSVNAGTAILTYNADIFQFQSFSGEGTHNPTAAGVLKHTFAFGDSRKSHSFTCTFKALKPGESKFSLVSEDMVNFDEEDLFFKDQAVTLKAMNPTLSGNADLASLKPSRGTLSPKFSPSKTDYTIRVPYTTTSLSLSATTADKGAKIQVSGKNSLQVGKNTQIITVTAPNGTTKKYTVVITRGEQQTTAPDGETSETTTAPPAKDALEVTVNGVLMKVSDTQPAVDLPVGFYWSYVPLNGVQVSAAKNDASGLTLLYLTGTGEDAEGAFYIYNEGSGDFSPFRPLTVNKKDFVLLDMPSDIVPPAGTVAGTFSYGGMTVDAFTYTDTFLGDYTLLYALSPSGRAALYVYDELDETLQRYYTPPVTGNAEIVDTPEPGEDNKPSKVIAFFTDYRHVLLISAAVLCGLALLITAIILAVRLLPHSGRGRH